jgi:hypothetical protein
MLDTQHAHPACRPAAHLRRCVCRTADTLRMARALQHRAACCSPPSGPTTPQPPSLVRRPTPTRNDLALPSCSCYPHERSPVLARGYSHVDHAIWLLPVEACAPCVMLTTAESPSTCQDPPFLPSVMSSLRRRQPRAPHGPCRLHRGCRRRGALLGLPACHAGRRAAQRAGGGGGGGAAAAPRRGVRERWRWRGGAPGPVDHCGGPLQGRLLVGVCCRPLSVCVCVCVCV